MKLWLQILSCTFRKGEKVAIPKITNLMHKICFTISLFYASTCFERYVLIVRRSKLYYTASGIFTPVGVMIPEAKCDDTRGCII